GAGPARPGRPPAARRRPGARPRRRSGAARGGRLMSVVTPPVRVGMWGANASGKTVFLGALLFAALRSDHGSWRVAADSTASQQWLAEQTEYLRRGLLPPASQKVEELSLIVDGQPGGTLLDQAKSFWAHGGRRVTLALEVLDGPGLLY